MLTNVAILSTISDELFYIIYQIFIKRFIYFYTKAEATESKGLQVTSATGTC